MKFFDAFLLIILLVVLAGASYFLYLNFPGEEISLKPDNGIPKEDIIKNSENGEPGQSKQFYDNMRFPDRIISYSIDSECSRSKEERAAEAFSILQSMTILQFTRVDSNGEILVLCSDISPEPEQRGHFVAGEGGPTRIINTSLYAVILEGKMSLYKEDRCETSHIALHETLHVLGFDHNQNPESILYPTLDCDQKVDQYIIDKINKLYLTPGAPDLAISDVSASKSGRYLNFDISITNQGLKNATGVILTVLSDGEEVGEFDLEMVGVGSTKTLNVQNVKLPSRSSSKVTLSVDKGNDIIELAESNNEVELSVSG